MPPTVAQAGKIMNPRPPRIDPVGDKNVVRSWVASSYADARAVLVNASARVPPNTRPSLETGGGAAHAIVERGAFLRDLWMWGCEVDRRPQRHKAGAAALGPKSIDALAAYLKGNAANLLADAKQAPEMDLVADFARPLVRDALMELLGIAPAARASLDTQVGGMAPFIPGGQSGSTAPYFALAAVAQAVENVWAKPLPPLAGASRALRGAVEAGELTLDEALAQATLLLFGNSYTTLDALAGLLSRCAEQPLLWRAARDGTCSVAALVEEGLRLGPPTHLALFRDAADDIQCPGGTIPAGTRIVLPLDRINRDPAAFDRPDSFEPGRSGPLHLAFGGGRHMCVGLHLARAVIRTGVETVLSRLPEWPADTRIVRQPGILGGPSVVSLTVPAGAFHPC